MKIKKIIYVLFTLCLFTSAIYPQINEGVDPNFVPVISKTPADPSLSVSAKLQPDGKLLAFGNVLNGLVRYNTDGNLDTSFLCSGCGSINISSVAVQPDGKIIAAGSTPEYIPRPKIIRLNADGSLDNSFLNPFSTTGIVIGIVTIQDIQSDGKIYVQFTQYHLGNAFGKVYRLETNGSIDNLFSLGNASSTQAFTNLKILPDGRIFVFGRTPYGILAQINTDGSKNNSFETPTYTSQGFQSPPISSIGLQSNGKLVIAGEFDSINGIGRKNLARLNANSSLDLDFNPQIPPLLFVSRGQVKVISGDKLLVAQEGSSNQQLLYRLNPDGTIDNSYTPPNTYGFFSDVDAQDRAYFVRVETSTSRYKITRLNPNGTLDTSYNPVLDTVGAVNALAVQTDGKIIAAGDFERVNGFTSSGIARINTNGTVDTSFNAPAISADSIKDIVIQSDGKILVGGTNGLIRLNSNGSQDASFNPNISATVNTIALQADGKILIGGTFSNVNGVARISIARLNADGTLDAAFDPVVGGTSPAVYDIISPADGKIVFGGNFTGVNGFNRSNLVRLNSDGSLDTSFTNNTVTNIIVRQPDGKYLLVSLSGIKRINSDGSDDSSFATVTNTTQILSVYLQPDGSIVIGGTFSSVNLVIKNRIARLFSDGTLDNSFLPSGADAAVRALAAQSDGKLIVGGSFSRIGNVTRYALARLTLISVPNRVRFDYDGDGKADVSVFRPSNGAWYIQQSTAGFTGVSFGASTDLIVPADYDGDGKTDVAVFRPSNGSWYYLKSSNGSFFGVQFGQAGDIPIPGDFDDDGKADISVFRPSTGAWYRLNSTTGAFFAVSFGQNGDKPLLADFDGDGKNDIAVFRPSNLTFYWLQSSDSQFRGYVFPAPSSAVVPIVEDYDGDGITDFAVVRADGFWTIRKSSEGFITYFSFGQNGDIFVPADYDGDGKANLAVFRPTTNSWYIARPTGTPAQNFDAVQFGVGTDKPTPAAFRQ